MPVSPLKFLPLARKDAMRKLKLDIQELEVESFTILSSPVAGGTVEGRARAINPVPVSEFFTECEWYCGLLTGNTCGASCGGTCANQGSCGADPTCLYYTACGPT